MNFWWVNHNHTSDKELSGGYIWSPTKNRNGSVNQTYLNLKKVQQNDIVFSYAAGEINAIGRVEQQAIDNPRPFEFGEVGEQWGRDGWLVKVDWTLVKHSFKPKQFIGEIAPLLPISHSPIQPNGNGNQICYLAEINDPLGKLLINLAGMDEELKDLIITAEVIQKEETEEKQIKNSEIPETEKFQLIKARIGQGIFRTRVEAIENQCRMTGIRDKRFLIASHIKPWRDSSNEERLEGNNGLLMSPHVDLLFGKGWISFLGDGKILCPNENIRTILKAWGLDTKKGVGPFTNEQCIYLEYHRNNIFRSN